MIALSILVFGTTIYLVWAYIHHKRDKSLTFAIFIEYLLTALLAIILLTGVML